MNNGSNDFLRALFGEKDNVIMKDDFTDSKLVELIKKYVNDEEYNILNSYFGLEIESNNKYSFDEAWAIVKKYKDPKLGLSKTIWEQTKK